ncbi:hypothetical protein [Microbacterium elymi]|uniref:Uncharacterized protein n=1 Tax=Microbacterium elymi TaxID=2909587 RepID=A0ABY5NGG4_9MICO|nr:hypothetical protein [Microbacterium elymi]UUT34303.1 hypothetical protein L2X98_26935 [Microbacterium elymi]
MILAFDPEGELPTERLGPVDQLTVATGIRSERPAVQDRAELVDRDRDRDGDVDVFVSVDARQGE